MNWNKWHPKYVTRNIKREITVLYKCYKNESTPWYAKLAILLVVIYALSPIDLVPDFIPILGYFDDLILLPLGIWLAYKLIPDEVINIEKILTENLIPEKEAKSKKIVGAIVIIFIWVLIVWAIVRLISK
ncbi:uncharacterized membrane protein YkvA (DUF1232 family) [Clostridium pascui]|uniref:YkvA family protein n=1 Tax=Clostridium pascui TaxID=46609 RepID=UPI0019578F42|nr:YkvA family protein [Clostridium pascui]MBM7871019.1 uncharacterized membrane protein YkvA (DUF1232 family) [Clostridium pascui]